MDYAVSGAPTNKTLWPSKSTSRDFLEQVGVFLNQSNNLDPATTLYTVYFGINDVVASHKDGVENLPAAAQVVLDQIQRLAAPPTLARSFLVTDSYGRGTQEPAGDAYKKKVFNGLAELRFSLPLLQIGYVDFGYIWNAVLNTEPGYAAFGYNSPGAVFGIVAPSSELAPIQTIRSIGSLGILRNKLTALWVTTSSW
ncbi:putative GDSL-like lipase/acylhydrolase domain protein [Rhizoctonia solani 123E]|uniref:Putative GDSL-like lipase/acylhydrolase domain protein n=1 Tax=Rhizoctonia solani 123E TaxID=1423351 RepID=A0A074RSY6_9AGAM|nr:putative GDSL-like lipase/acylhydrolase domain protein [Rhizoctonia solani 123E]